MIQPHSLCHKHYRLQQIYSKQIETEKFTILTPNELVLTFGGLHVCVQFGENRRKNATVRVSTDGQTHTRSDAKRFYYLSHAICYSYGADNYSLGSVTAMPRGLHARPCHAFLVAICDVAD